MSFQAGASLATGLFPVFGPTGTVLLRVGLAAIILGAAFRPWRGRLDRAAWGAVIPYGIALGLMNTLFYCALARMKLGPTVAIEFTGPLGLALLGSKRAADFVALALAVAGLALLVGGGAAVPTDRLGVAFALGAALCWASYIVAGTRLGTVMPATRGVALGMAVAAAVVLPIGIGALGTLSARPALLVPAIAVAVLSSAAPYVLELAAMRRLPTRSFGILMSLEPAVAAGCGLLLLGQRLGVARVIGIACVVAASLATVLHRPPANDGATP